MSVENEDRKPFRREARARPGVPELQYESAARARMDVGVLLRPLPVIVWWRAWIGAVEMDRCVIVRRDVADSDRERTEVTRCLSRYVRALRDRDVRAVDRECAVERVRYRHPSLDDARRLPDWPAACCRSVMHAQRVIIRHDRNFARRSCETRVCRRRTPSPLDRFAHGTVPQSSAKGFTIGTNAVVWVFSNLIVSTDSATAENW